MNNNIKKWLFAFFLSIPIIFLYTLHFINHDSEHKPTGLIQWEHALYMIAAKEYKTGDATILYRYPLADDLHSPKVFFQPQTFITGYLWNWFPIDPGIILTIFGLIFTIFTTRVIIGIIETISPIGKYNKMLAILFTWGGGVLSICGLILHFTYFKGIGDLTDHVLLLDPSQGWWCLNFGRTLIYPFEAYYHCLFMLIILFVLRKQFRNAALIMVLLTISHPYTSTELTAIIFTWLLVEYYYLKSTEINKNGLFWLGGAIIFQVFYYGVLLKLLPVYSTISQQSTLDWGYKIWHFLPAYFLVWALSFYAVKNVALLQKHFSNYNNRLFFCWGSIAFLLSVHGFAIKPVQPLHFTRGYVYAGFFLFCIPTIVAAFDWMKSKPKFTFVLIASLTIIIFLSDNIAWFYFQTSPNVAGVYFTKNEQELINFFKDKNQQGWVVGPEKRDDLSTYIQLFSGYKAWIPHPFLTFDLIDKKQALQNLIKEGQLDKRWQFTPSYLYIEKKDTSFTNHPFNFPIKFENESFKVFQINKNINEH